MVRKHWWKGILRLQHLNMVEEANYIRPQVRAQQRWGWSMEAKGKSKVTFCSHCVQVWEGRGSSGPGADCEQDFRSWLAASSGLITEQSGQSVEAEGWVEAGEGEGHQTDAESRQGGCSWTWMKLPIESWLKFGSSLRFDTRGGVGANCKAWLETWGSTSIQSVTEHKNTVIGSWWQNTT